MAELDRQLRGWVIPTEDLAIAMWADGSPWLLGSGGFGRVRRVFSRPDLHPPPCSQHPLTAVSRACGTDWSSSIGQWPLAGLATCAA